MQRFDVALSIDYKFQGLTAVIALAGELDLYGGRQLCQAINDSRPLLSGLHTAVIDLHALTFVDCAGVASLLCVEQLLLGDGVRCRFTDPPACVRRVLNLTGAPLSAGDPWRGRGPSS